ncbi:MAG TPA: hypothetical protein VKE49_03725 [Myxococcaceae bacterium]|nr:hypothetical protein [Myxococcaceae bacterium]
MIKQFRISLALGGLAMLLGGCSGSETKGITPPPAKVDDSSKAEMQEVWLQVDGMSERLKIT